MQAVLLGFLALSVATAAGAQQNDRSSYVLRHTVHRVLEDVVVTDRAGHPVTDLKPGDLTLQEDGVTQKILSFTLNDGRLVTYTPPEIPPLGPHTFVNVPTAAERGPLYVILYDMVNMELDSQARSRAPLARLIENAPPGVRIALFVNAHGLKLVQGFTTDHALLLKAITTEGPGLHLPRMVLDGVNFGRGNVGATVFNFNRLSEYLSGMQGRKNLIWISSKFPLAMMADAVEEQGTSVDAVEAIRKTTAAMARAEIAVYPVSADGLSVAGGFGRTVRPQDQGVGPTSQGAPSSGASGSPTPGGTSVGTDGESSGDFKNATQAAAMMASASGNLYANYSNMDVVAQATGGRSFQSNNDLDGIFREAMEDGSTFYTLSYSPTNKSENGRARKVHIFVNRPGLVLSYRTLYYMLPAGQMYMAQPVLKTGDNPAILSAANIEMTSDEEFAALEHGAPLAHDMIFSAKISQAAGPTMATRDQMAQLTEVLTAMRLKEGHKLRKADTASPPEMLTTWRVHYNFYAPMVPAGTRQSFELALVAYDGNGHMLNGSLENVSLDPAPVDGKRRTVHCDLTVLAPTRAASLRVAVREVGTGRTGALEVPLPLDEAQP